MSPEVEKYLDMFMSMALDCKMGGITPMTFAINAELAAKRLQEVITDENVSEGATSEVS